MRYPALLGIALVAAMGLMGCGGSRDPVRDLGRDLNRYPEYLLIVEDVRVVEGFFPDYYLRFKTLAGSGQRVAGKDTLIYEERTTDWHEVSQEVFARYEHFVGMVVASKSKDGRRTDVRQAHPPGYQYVGNPSYGFWGGGGFWQFYGQYALMRDLMGGWRVNRDDYRGYRRNSERGRPYYGPVHRGRPTFGARGTVTEKTKPGFYQRNRQRLRSGRQGFASTTQGRMGRTGSSWGRGGYGFRGK